MKKQLSPSQHMDTKQSQGCKFREIAKNSNLKMKTLRKDGETDMLKPVPPPPPPPPPPPLTALKCACGWGRGILRWSLAFPICVMWFIYTGTSPWLFCTYESSLQHNMFNQCDSIIMIWYMAAQTQQFIWRLVTYRMYKRSPNELKWLDYDGGLPRL